MDSSNYIAYLSFLFLSIIFSSNSVVPVNKWSYYYYLLLLLINYHCVVCISLENSTVILYPNFNHINTYLDLTQMFN